MVLVDTVTVVGVGADGWAGLAEPGRAAVRTAEVRQVRDRLLISKKGLASSRSRTRAPPSARTGR